MRRLVILGLIALLAGCEQTPTPFPVDIPTATTAVSAASAPQHIRYALAPNIAGTRQTDSAGDPRIEMIQLSDPINLETLGSQYDIIVTYGAYDDSVPSPTLINYALLINTTLSPLDDPKIAAVVRQVVNPASLTTGLDIPDVRIAEHETQSKAALQTALANAGWPDGFDLSFGHDSDLLALTEIHEQFGALNIRLGDQPLTNDFASYHLALVTWTTPSERSVWTDLLTSEDDLIELFGLPISYWAVPGLNVSFGPQGWPVVLLPTPEAN